MAHVEAPAGWAVYVAGETPTGVLDVTHLRSLLTVSDTLMDLQLRLARAMGAAISRWNRAYTQVQMHLDLLEQTVRRPTLGDFIRETVPGYRQLERLVGPGGCGSPTATPRPPRAPCRAPRSSSSTPVGWRPA